jgi:hypothetical protein
MKRFLTLALICVLAVACNKVWTPASEMEGDLRIVAHDINLDLTAAHVFASDFVAKLHVGDSEEIYSGPVVFEMYVPHLEDPWWMEEWHFECEDLGAVDIWVRALYADPHDEAKPVKVQMTLVDSMGACGWPQNPETPPEHGEQEE